MTKPHSTTSPPSLQTITEDNSTLKLKIKGALNAYTTSKIWTDSLTAIKTAKPSQLVVDGSEIDYCDTAGIAFFTNLQIRQEQLGGNFKVEGLSDEINKLYKLFDAEQLKEPDVSDSIHTENKIEAAGRWGYEAWEEIQVNIIFTGRVTVALIKAILRPDKIRWKDVFITCEKFGANALFIIALVNFLVGLVIAFQSAVPMKQYGAQIFVADLLVIAYFKELGPLMTAFVVNGRSGSAFAAELGTMKVNEELDALDTMGLDPVPFLVVPKVIASLLMLPLLTVFGNLFGLLGGLVVMFSLGFTLETYLNQLTIAATYGMLISGLFKTLFFAVIIAGVGCLAGMRAAKGPSAVGDAATRAVVVGIVLMIVVDGIFGVIYYILGI
ncbi:MAG: glycoprotein endopeptidase metalloprotease [Thermodesulfobacteriota bacterium]|nr:MAG: glycoprotein endopeptidase metalloprotease [Thermodesulfobacteriota bacterium]